MSSSLSTLQHIADLAGFSTDYINAHGQPTQVSESALTNLLTSVGYDLSDTESLLNQLRNQDNQHCELKSVYVFKQSDLADIQLDHTWSESQVQLVCENDSKIELNLVDRLDHVSVRIPKQLPLGYHQLVVKRQGEDTQRAGFVVTPDQCYLSEKLARQQKMWGTSIQLYTLRSNNNWGIGDFGDLKHLIQGMAKFGADFVGLNPIHALFPANPESASPYSPSSRRWLNWIYLDVANIADYFHCEQAQLHVDDQEFQLSLDKLRASPWVDYSGVMAAKRPILKLLFDNFCQQELSQHSVSSRAQCFARFKQLGGEALEQQAVFDALHFHLGEQGHWGWPAFPEQYRSFDSPAVKAFASQHPELVEFEMYLQWQTDCQLNACQIEAKDAGMDIGLYRDLAVGVSDGGSETWGDKGCLVQSVSIGAPPDILGPLGQNWGLPPMDPDWLVKHEYREFIDLLRANMAHCGALRIDHVLGLLRLWWIPKGSDATEGVYRHYPVEDLLAILAFESHRQQCSVVGEDLGTVPEEIKTLLKGAGVHSYKVFFFETSKQDGGFISPGHYEPQSMATLCTHDMPTLRGFWHCDDLKLGEQLGLYLDFDVLKSLFDARLKDKQAILDSMAWHGTLPESVGRDAQYVGMDWNLASAMQTHLAAGSSALYCVELEDWLAMDSPVNIPGTTDQYPNWRRKLTQNLDVWLNEPRIQNLAQAINQARNG